MYDDVTRFAKNAMRHKRNLANKRTDVYNKLKQSIDTSMQRYLFDHWTFLVSCWASFLFDRTCSISAKFTANEQQLALVLDVCKELNVFELKEEEQKSKKMGLLKRKLRVIRVI